MTTTQTKLLLVGISLTVAVVGLYSTQANAEDKSVSGRLAEKATYVEKVLALKPVHESLTTQIKAVETESTLYRGKIDEIDTEISNKLNPPAVEVEEPKK